MRNLTSVKRFFYLGLFLLFVSCSKGDGGGAAEPSAVLASGLVYSPASLALQEGTAGSSSKPSISGTLPITYSLTTSPTSSAITIGTDGKINSASTLAVGSYTVSVTAANAAGSVKFDNAYTINVTAAPGPQSLTYSPASATVTQGTAVSSALPSVTSTSAVTYAISSTPSSSAITISNQGVISATNALVAGSYSISVTATNATGARTFTNAYTIVVNAQGGGGTTVGYDASIKAIIQNNCGSCHINGPQREFGNYTAAKNNIDEILRRINLAQGAAGMMPSNGTKLSQQTINTIQKWKDDGLLQ